MSQHYDRIKNDPRWHEARRDCLDRDGSTCLECGSIDQPQVDHIIPLSIVLADEDTEYLAFDLDNLQTLCKPCNQAKGAKVHGDGQVVRHQWVNPRYPEVAAAVFRDETQGPRSLASSQNRVGKIQERAKE